MQFVKKTFLALCAVASITSSCSDFLDIKDESAINPSIWDSYQASTLYINNIYAKALPEFGGETVVGSTKATSVSDETTSMPDLLIGELQNDQVGFFGAGTYQTIRYINIALNNMKTSAMTEEEQNKILGQLYFFRAWQHWRIVLHHGGAPYMTDVVYYDSEQDLYNAKRNTTSECIEFIRKDLEKATAMLPATWSSDDYGRITRGCAAALWGRVALYWASPQFNPYNEAARWQQAYEANATARTICDTDGYGLLDCSVQESETWPAPTDINKIFLIEGNKEVLFTTLYSFTGNKTHGYENSVRPAYETNNSESPANCPSWDLVTAFPMRDGSMYTANDKYFYKNRDPRFYSTVVYNGCYYPLNGDKNRRQWTYQYRQGSSMKYGEGPTVTVSNASSTGFFCRKMVNPSYMNDLGKTETDAVELRYAEVILNLAECAMETGKTDEGFELLKMIRQRAGIEPGADGFYGLKSVADITPIELVMIERRCEFAFEGKRFYDLRRRNMFTKSLGNYCKALNGFMKVGSRKKFTISSANHTKIVNNPQITIDEVMGMTTMADWTAGPTAKPINYLCKELPEDLAGYEGGNYNFFDIPSGILLRSPAIIQNMGWSKGTFNPFE
ncbi:MAG: RagB/SusD family nutrient uptake outer membrane protein [Bacteroidales bacterium]